MSPGSSAPFGPELFAFLRDLKRNNRRDWFQRNKRRYEEEVLEPALHFISDFGPRLHRISPHFLAVPRPQGGSLFRIYRDTRFSRDKSPYKTHVGIRFPHKDSRDVHAPGFYLHLEPRQSFIGVGIWHPDTPTLKRVRDAIVDDPGGWKRVRQNRRFRERFEIGGDTLKRAPRGYEADHPLVEDLMRKDFVGYSQLDDKDVLAADFPARFAVACRQGTPLVRFLCGAVGAPF